MGLNFIIRNGSNQVVLCLSTFESDQLFKLKQKWSRIKKYIFMIKQSLAIVAGLILFVACSSPESASEKVSDELKTEIESVEKEAQEIESKTKEIKEAVKKVDELLKDI